MASIENKPVELVLEKNITHSYVVESDQIATFQV